MPQVNRVALGVGGEVLQLPVDVAGTWNGIVGGAAFGNREVTILVFIVALAALVKLVVATLELAHGFVVGLGVIFHVVGIPHQRRVVVMLGDAVLLEDRLLDGELAGVSVKIAAVGVDVGIGKLQVGDEVGHLVDAQHAAWGLVTRHQQHEQHQRERYVTQQAVHGHQDWLSVELSSVCCSSSVTA